MRLTARVRQSLLLAAVVVAFADSSIVVLGVPAIVSDLDATISDASWVITAYNLAVVVAAAILLPVLARFDLRRLAAAGLVAFAIASVGCAAAPTLGTLVAFRGLQGAAAASVMVACFPFLGARAWTAAATIGFAAGPALGGFLTEAFSWRAIFAAQAPLVAVGLFAVGAAVATATGDAARGRRAWLADAALVALSAALVGALFLVVVLMVAGFAWQPLPAALVATTLPVLAAVGQWAGSGLPNRAAVASGGVLVALGLATLAFLPGPNAGLILTGLALCGAGLGLATRPLAEIAHERASSADAAWTVIARHAGLVLALLVVTPVLVSSVDELKADAEAVGGDLVLRSELPLSVKAPLILDLAGEIDAEEAALPPLGPTFERNDDGSGAVTALGRRVTGRLHELVARAFREPFLVCAGFGLAGALLALGFGRAAHRARAPAAAFVVVALLVACAALVADVSLGALDRRPTAADPCRDELSFPGRGAEATAQRVALSTLGTAACDLGTSPGELLGALVGSGSGPWGEDELNRALRSAMTAAIEHERRSGTISDSLASLLLLAAENAPYSWLRAALEATARR